MEVPEVDLVFEEIDDDRQTRRTCHFLNVDEDYTKLSGEVLRRQGVSWNGIFRKTGPVIGMREHLA